MIEFPLTENWHTPCYENLNSLDWVDGFSVSDHGVRLGIRVNDPSLLPILTNRLPKYSKPANFDNFDCVFSIILGGREPGSRTRKYHLLYHNHTVMARSHNLEDVLDRFDTYYALAIAQLAPKRVFIHAGVVGWRGKAIVIPGKTLSGKSTLVAELVRQGAEYYSDEFTVLDSDGYVHPYHKPIAMRPTPTSRQVNLPIDELKGVMGYTPIPVSLVVLTKYKLNAVWRPKKLSHGAGILGMLENSVGAQYAPERVLKTLSHVANRASFVKSPRGECRAKIGRASCRERV